MSTIDEQFVEFIVKSLVSEPDAVIIERRIDEKGVLIELTVAPDDLGRVIGKRGATAQSIRTLLRALGTKNDARYNLKIVDNGAPQSERPAPAAAPVSDDQPADDTVAADDASDDSSDEDENNDSNRTSSLADRTREELKELDDLDI